MIISYKPNWNMQQLRVRHILFGSNLLNHVILSMRFLRLELSWLPHFRQYIFARSPDVSPFGDLNFPVSVEQVRGSKVLLDSKFSFVNPCSFLGSMARGSVGLGLKGLSEVFNEVLSGFDSYREPYESIRDS